MKKLLAAAIGILVLVSVGALAYRMGWLASIGLGSPAQPAAGTAPTAGAAVPPTGAPAASSGPTSPASPAQQEPGGGVPGTPGAPEPPNSMPRPAPPVFDGNVAALEWGGAVERITGAKGNSPIAFDVIDDNPASVWRMGPDQREVVIGFYEREPVLVQKVVVVAGPQRRPEWANDRQVEVATSMTGPAESDFGATAGSAPLRLGEETTVAIGPVEARYVRVRLTANQASKGEAGIAELRVFEGQRAGYTTLLTRRPELTWAPPQAGPEAAQPVAGAAGATASGCAPRNADTPVRPGHEESRKVLSIVGIAAHPVGSWKRGARRPFANKDMEILERLEVTEIRARQLRSWMLGPKYGYDTVLLENLCEEVPHNTLPPFAKRALIDWVAAGHKLIIHDSDKCSPGPKYDWLPYRFKTDNPGAQGAKGKDLQFVEDNAMAHGQPGTPGFIDVKAWVDNQRPYRNELGDCNTIVQWDPHWCGHMAVRNINKVFGFTEAYARYGRGLLIYNGYDIDQAGTFGYDELAIRELAQGFDPDNLPCSASLGNFIIKTDGRLVEQRMAQGQSFTYPLTLLPNQGYKGRVNLSLTTNPPVQGVQARFDPASVDVTDVAGASLTVTIPAGAPDAVALAVRGVDAAGASSGLCLFLSPPRSGTLSIMSTLAAPSKTGKNLEIILDGSGSMKTAMGKSTRWQTALDVLGEVVEQLPAGFNVGLRLYGHREASTSPKTCTDTELVVPIRPINRDAIVKAAERVKPRGETPLVYSVLQAPGDLKRFGGGSVILITDGEESCKGDPVKAAEELKASGLDVRLNIVGFAIAGKVVQKTLTSFAESTGGRFYTAQSGAALAQALIVATIDRLPFKVYDAAGKEVAGGEAGGAPIDLPAGEYKVVVKAGTQDLVAERVKVTLAGDTKLRVTLKENQVVIE
jgi:hypothetical protein